MKPSFPPLGKTAIVPSILSADFSCLKKEIRSIEKHSGWIQLDVMDGYFVPNLSFGPHIAGCLRRITALPIDVHLMVKKPLCFIDPFVKSGVDLITCHIESDNFLKALRKVKSLGIKAGLALNPDTPFEYSKRYLKEIDLLLIMSVNPGFGGQKFMPQSLEKIRQASLYRKESGLKFYIQVDGGVCRENAGICAVAGADSLVMGSAIFKEKNPNFISKISKDLRRLTWQ